MGLSFRVRNGTGRAPHALAADRWAAPSRTLELRRGRPRGLPLFSLYKLIFALSVLRVLGLTLVEGIVVVRGEVEPIFLLM